VRIDLQGVRFFRESYEFVSENRMRRNARKPNWNRVIEGLRRGVAAGDAASMKELGLTVADGIQDRHGRALVRRNAPYAVRLFRLAIANGDESACGPLGYAYDVGNGTKRNKSLALFWYRRAVRHGDSGSATNIATIYRDQGDLRAMVRWWLRAAAMDDGDAMVDAGYCYQYGIGVRRNLASARRLYRRAFAARSITMWAREEGHYQLALSYIDEQKRSLAIPLLHYAARDGDYPEAEALLRQISMNDSISACRCRRHINKALLGHANCPIHPRRPRQNS